jgi:AraC-like DNA-binding protein
MLMNAVNTQQTTYSNILIYNFLACLSRLHRVWPVLLWSLLSNGLYAQVRLVVEQVPKYTPRKAELYLASSLNGWNPADLTQKFVKNADGTFSIDLPDAPRYFEYKITMGSWESVEGNEKGERRTNRVYQGYRPPKDKTVDTLRNRIASWEGVGYYTFIINNLPKDTPHDAAIYVSGNFNGWNSGHPDYRLQFNSDSTYSISFPCPLDTIEYKFTRGTWKSVEGRGNGQAISNRKISRMPKQAITQTLSIASWEDLAYTIFNPYDLLLLLSAFQGILLIIALFSIQDNNKKANQLLSFLIFVVSVALFGRVSVDYKELFKDYPKMLLVSDIILFGYAPLFYFYIQKLLTVRLQSYWKSWAHFIPFFLHVLAYMPLILMDDEVFKAKNVNREFALWFAVAGGIALVYNTFYWFRSFYIIRSYQKRSDETYSFEQNLNYLNKVMLFKALCLIVWLLTYLFPLIGMLTAYDTLWITEKSTDTLWLLFAGITYFLGYFAIHQPEIFKMSSQKPRNLKQMISEVANVGHTEPQAVAAPEPPAEVPAQNEAPPVVTVEDDSEKREQMQRVKQKLEHLMNQKKPYTNPKLTIAELAELMNVDMRLLSRVINEIHEKNFHDFINTYRINEFIRLMNNDKYKNYTFLALAFEVGFNSKTAFNRSFKKMMNKTPREYFNDSRIED